MTLYCKHSADIAGCHFVYSEHKIVCNPDENETFYMKLGGIVYLSKKEQAGKKIRKASERITDSDYFGAYIYISDHDKKIRTLLYARRRTYPDSKLVSQPGILHNVIPKYCGNDEHHRVLVGMEIDNESATNRRWNQFDHEWNNGLSEIKLADLDRKLRDFSSIHPYNLIGIYVGQNTSLVMVDFSLPNLHSDSNFDCIYTLVQEGGFIYTHLPFEVRLYDEDEGKPFTTGKLFDERDNRFNDTQDFYKIATQSQRIIFLKPTPNNTLWALRVFRPYGSRETSVQLCVPSDAQFDKIMDWTTGCLEVRRLQGREPWHKYIDLASRQFYSHEFLDMSRNEPYPQCDCNRCRDN